MPLGVSAILSVLFALAPPTSLAGHWEGQWVKKGAKIAVEFDFTAKGGTFTSLPQAVMNYPLDSVGVKGGRAEFVLGGGMKFSGNLTQLHVEGTFDDGDGGGSFSLRRAAKAPLPYVAREVRFGGANAKLAGTLCLPKGRGPFPGIILLHGSGPQSRWGTLRYAADQMARHGIAALCWDQRGSGDSGGKWYASTYDDLVSDAIAGIELLKRNDHVDKRKIGVYGHSQGGTIAPLLATRKGDLAFLIAGAPIVGKVYVQDLFRVRNILKAQPLSAPEVDDAMAFYHMWLDVARTGEGREAMEAKSVQVKGEKWYSTVEPPGRESYIWSYYPHIGNTDTVPFWAKIRIPALILWGERDEIEDVSQYSLRVDNQLQQARNRDYTIAILPRARHELKVDSEPGAPFEWRRPSPGLYDLLIAWIRLRFAR